MNILNPPEQMTLTRRAMTVAGVATVVFSLVLSIVPAMAANAGTMKIYDENSNAEATGNQPHVCGFYAEFTGTDVTGAWTLYDWSNGHVQVDSGTFAIVGVGTYVTDAFELPAGQYRFEGQSSADNAAKSKTLWVDEGCEYAAASPSDEPTPTPTEQSAPSDEPTPTPTEQSVEASQSTPSPVATPEQDVEAGTGTASTPLPDTAVPVSESGVLAAIGLLLIIAAHAGTRRKRPLPVA